MRCLHMKKKIIAIAAVLGIAAAAIFICRRIEPKQDEPPLVLNEYQREAYLNIRGWEIEEISCQTVRIPEEFEGIYREYADIQSKDGFKLENYKGKEVLRCLYPVSYTHLDVYKRQDQMCRNNAAERIFSIFFNENLIENITVISVQSQNGFIKKYIRSIYGKCYYNFKN